MSVSGIPGYDVLYSPTSTSVPGFDVLNPAQSAAASTAAPTAPAAGSSSSSLPGTSPVTSPSSGTSSSSNPSTSTVTTPSLSSDSIPGYSALFQPSATQAVTPTAAEQAASAQNAYQLSLSTLKVSLDQELVQGISSGASATTATGAGNALSGSSSILSELSQGYRDGLFQGTGGSVDTLA